MCFFWDPSDFTSQTKYRLCYWFMKLWACGFGNNYFTCIGWCYLFILFSFYVLYFVIFVEFQVLLGLSGVVLVMLSVLGSVGFFSAIGVKSTLIIMEVIPFLVLAVSFILNLFLHLSLSLVKFCFSSLFELLSCNRLEWIICVYWCMLLNGNQWTCPWKDE